MRRFWISFLGMLVAVGTLTVPSAGADQVVDVQLLLAIDVSRSVSEEEFDLQMQGFAAAFRHPAVVEAIRNVGSDGVAVAAFQWADLRQQRMHPAWTLLHDADSAAAFGRELGATPRLVGGDTALGDALGFALAELERSPVAGRRRVIDVSGDGRNNYGPSPEGFRDLAAAQGITINGLAILNEEPTLDRYYERSVIGGPGAFVIHAHDYHAFAQALVEKLVRELAAPSIARQGPTGQETRDLPTRAAVR